MNGNSPKGLALVPFPSLLASAGVALGGGLLSVAHCMQFYFCCSTGTDIGAQEGRTVRSCRWAYGPAEH